MRHISPANSHQATTPNSWGRLSSKIKKGSEVGARGGTEKIDLKWRPILYFMVCDFQAELYHHVMNLFLLREL